MIYDCDICQPAEQRYLSEKFRLLSRRIDPYKLPLAYADELRILMRTPGITHRHLRHMFHWTPFYLKQAQLLLEAKEPPEDLVLKNLHSITLEDGRFMLEAILDGRPNYSYFVPLHSTRYLRSLKGKHKAQAIAERFRTTPDRIRRWWGADMFHPLTGALREPGTTRRNRPFKSRRSIGVIV